MLRKIRLTLAVLSLTLVTLLFLDFTGTVHAWFSWLARIQFLPAVLALHVEIVVALVVLTLLFGRVYCSVGCATPCWSSLWRLWWPASVRWPPCWLPTAPTGASRRRCWLRCGLGATMRWPTWPNGWTATLSMRPTSGSRACPRCSWPSRRWWCSSCWRGATDARTATPSAPLGRCSACCRATP